MSSQYQQNTSKTLPRVAILGGGPAGLGAAWRLHRLNKGTAIVVERQREVGGNAGSFELEGITVDYGSHRLHPACDPEILADLKGLLRDDLLDRPRHGRIRLRGRWIHFPLKPFDLLWRLPPSFGLGVARDSLGKAITRQNGNGDGTQTFTTVLERGLGRTVCREFYFPYARKIWGMAPDALSAQQARRRVSANSLGKLVLKVLGGARRKGEQKPGRFFYPRKGFGQISQRIGGAALELGADVRLNTSVKGITLGSPHRVEIETGGVGESFETEHIWSTIPITNLIKLIKPAAPPDVLAACDKIKYRSMILIYLVLDENQFTPYDAHYFPEAEIKLTRLSEPKNYSNLSEPADRTVLCGELPCAEGDEVWNASDEDLAGLVGDCLARCGLPITSRIVKVTTRRLPFAYPIYPDGYEENFQPMDEWVGGLENVLTFGRQGLFAHDNTHHALAMAYAAVECLDERGSFDRPQWGRHRERFAEHVVED